MAEQFKKVNPVCRCGGWAHACYLRRAPVLSPCSSDWGQRKDALALIGMVCVCSISTISTTSRRAASLAFKTSSHTSVRLHACGHDGSKHTAPSLHADRIDTDGCLGTKPRERAALANGKQPMPQAAIAYLCEINRSTPCKDGIPVLTQDMVFNAFARLANPNQPVENYEQSVISYVRETVQRLRYANDLMPQVREDIETLHTKVDGNTDKLFAFFKDLLPEEAHANFTKQVFCHMVLKQPPTVLTVRLSDFLRAMKQNMDEKDTVEKIKATALKHIEAVDEYGEASPYDASSSSYESGAEGVSLY